ncbi:hypothetical protein AVAK2825_00270 [Acidovorax sp. SUPP2825]|nr:hypothetical protein AVAK2825_00270 [Acidovorax sp. SUPP2825]
MPIAHGGRRHPQPAASVLEDVGARLLHVPRDAVGHMALQVAQVIRGQALAVEAAQVVRVRLAGVDVAVVLWKEAQEALVPQHGAVLVVEDAQGDAQGVEQRGGQAVVHGQNVSKSFFDSQCIAGR